MADISVSVYHTQMMGYCLHFGTCGVVSFQNSHTSGEEKPPDGIMIPKQTATYILFKAERKSVSTGLHFYLRF